MSAAVAEMTERQLKFGLLKVALSFALVLILGAWLVSYFFQSDDKISSIPIYALLFAVAFSILANGFLAVLNIIDWFEKRRALRDMKNG